MFSKIEQNTNIIFSNAHRGSRGNRWAFWMIYHLYSRISVSIKPPKAEKFAWESQHEKYSFLHSTLYEAVFGRQMHYYAGTSIIFARLGILWIFFFFLNCNRCLKEHVLVNGCSKEENIRYLESAYINWSTPRLRPVEDKTALVHKCE